MTLKGFKSELQEERLWDEQKYQSLSITQMAHYQLNLAKLLFQELYFEMVRVITKSMVNQLAY